MLAQLMCADSPNNPSIDDTRYPAWNKSLIRTTVCSVLRLLRFISDHEDNTFNGNEVASCLSKVAFYEQLGKTMMEFRRKEGDNSPAIVWQTNPSRRFGDQFQSKRWKCVAYTINIESQSIPVARKKSKAPREVDFPMLALEKQSNLFNSMTAEFTISPLKVITMRLMLFMKKYKEKQERVKFTGKVWYDNTWAEHYFVTPEVHLRAFFWSEKSYKQHLKNCFYKAAAFLAPESKRGKEEKEKHSRRKASGKTNKKKDISCMLKTQYDYDLRQGDLMSIYSHDESGDRYDEEAIRTLHKMIDEDKPYKMINSYACDRQVITLPYAEHLYKQFQEYTADTLRDLRVLPARKRRPRPVRLDSDDSD